VKNPLMKRSLCVVLFILVSLASCVKHPITKVSVKIDDAFSGHFSLTTCIPGVEELAVLGETAEGYTSACPSGDVEITVIEPSKSFRIAPENVHVHRSHDGTPEYVSAQIP
jgi:hypothetical protein